MNNRDSETFAATALLDMPRLAKRLVALAVDVSLCVLTVWLALCLRLEQWVRLEPVHGWAVLGSVLLALPLFIRFGLYRAIFRYAGWNAMVSLLQAMTLYSVFYATVFTVISVPGIPRTVGVIQPLLLHGLVGSSAGWWCGIFWAICTAPPQRKDMPGVLIYGAGSAGRQLAAALARGTEHRLLGFLDDDAQLHGNSLDGRTVHAPAALPDLITELGVTDILLALPSTTHQRRLQVLESLRHLPVRVRTLPGMSDLASGLVSLKDVRELEIEDLLGREPVAPDAPLLQRLVNDKVVLITGAGGSIGSELCRQITACRPHTLLLVDSSEFALYQIHHELTALVGSQTDPLDMEEGDAPAPMAITLVPLLASVQDEARMRQIMQTWRPYTVYHAAAYKHVPLVEHNPGEGLRNNVWGTLVCALTARAAGVGQLCADQHRQGGAPHQHHGREQALAELVSAEPLSAEPGRDHQLLHGAFGNVLGSSAARWCRCFASRSSTADRSRSPTRRSPATS